LRDTCLKSSNITTNNPQELTSSNIVSLCNDSSARLAVLYNNDSFSNINFSSNSELWIDAYRSENIQTKFFSKDKMNSISYDSKEWDGGLSSSGLCATWKSDKQKFKSVECSSPTFPILCEKVLSFLSVNTKTFYNITEISCPSGWNLYRSSCFKQSVNLTSNFYSLTNDSIFSLCNDTSARLAILFETDYNYDILTTTLHSNESWIDAFRDNDTKVSFSSKNTESSLIFNNITWDGTLTNGELCATWNENLKLFNSRMCNLSFPILCEIPY
jgi:hypothetical protein